ncbi:MAG TPA: PcfJ domain-containing protein [Candidatus Stercoripulliclostridium merdipullorum]|uniref:PcfJ domain-containing protein n=1 Tax=Candidatus Stercoripulliclostridium merdipullorum TaxID=2840952 RepID=A0A9D1SXW0_9FIRM|nr:PcfJ domain-containing protein [Candidatus Stercoripulliclostridium merdipullorum]
MNTYDNSRAKTIARLFLCQKQHTVADLQAYKKYRMQLSKEAELKELRTFFKNDLEKFVLYIRSQNTNPYSYRDYLRACNYLGLDMTENKNRFPHDFKRWHDIRIDEYNTAKALKDEQERKALYDRFAAVASKYLGLEYDKKSVYIAIIAQKPSDLIHEGELLHHCVGRMGYDQKFAREESLIFFIRTKEQPDVPFVTIEYSPAQKRILQCYGDHDSKPTEEVINFVHKKWLPYANRKIKQLAAYPQRKLKLWQTTTALPLITPKRIFPLLWTLTVCSRNFGSSRLSSSKKVSILSPLAKKITLRTEISKGKPNLCPTK